MFLTDSHIIETGDGKAGQIDTSEDSGIGKLRAPIPSKHIMGLSERSVSFHAAGRSIKDISLPVRLFDKGGGGMEFNSQPVYSL